MNQPPSSTPEDFVVKVVDGTRTLKNGVLCNTCSKCARIRGVNDTQEIYYCHEIGEKLKFQPVDCSSYYPKNLPRLYDLYQMAWIIETNKKSKQIGFIPFKEWQESHKGEVLPSY